MFEKITRLYDIVNELNKAAFSDDIKYERLLVELDDVKNELNRKGVYIGYRYGKHDAGAPAPIRQITIETGKFENTTVFTFVESGGHQYVL